MTTITRTSTPWARVWAFAHRVVRIELRIYESIGRAVARRPAVPRDGTGFAYHQPVQTLLIIFIVLSAVEIPIIDLIVHRWPPVRIALLIVGIWGLTWMIGLLCAFHMRPHTVGRDGIRIREGLELDIPLRWDDIASVERVRHVDEPKTPRFTDIEGRRVLSVRMQDETNIEIALERLTRVRLPGREPKGGAQQVQVVRLWVDDPDGFMVAVRAAIP
jgi:hypothetical protein